MTKNINNLNAPTKQAVKAALSLRKRGRLSSRFEDKSKVDEDIWGESNCCVKEYWAVMERNGTLVRGRNVLRVKKLSTGTYEVFFTGDVNNAAFNVTVGRPGISTEPPGFGCVALRYVDGNTDWMPFAENKGVWVQTFDANGKLADRAFHLVVMAQ